MWQTSALKIVIKRQTSKFPSSLHTRMPWRSGTGEGRQTVDKQDENEIHSMLGTSAKEKEKKQGKGVSNIGEWQLTLRWGAREETSEQVPLNKTRSKGASPVDIRGMGIPGFLN